MDLTITWADVHKLTQANPLFGAQLENIALRRMLDEEKGEDLELVEQAAPSESELVEQVNGKHNP